MPSKKFDGTTASGAQLPSWYTPVSVTFGIVLFLCALLIVLVVPNPTETQSFTIRVSIAIAASVALGTNLPGFLKLNLSPWGQNSISADGAFAVFLIVYQFNPPPFGTLTFQDSTDSTTVSIDSNQQPGDLSNDSLSNQQYELLLTIRPGFPLLLAELFNNNTCLIFPSVAELATYKVLAKKGYVSFNQDVFKFEQFIKQHGFKIDDWSHTDDEGYANKYIYTSDSVIPHEIAHDLKRFAVELTTKGKRFNRQVIAQIQ